jgi:hypothetical protein
MDREEKTLAITALSCLIYGFASFSEHGVFVFLTPLHEILFLAITLFFAAYDFRTFKAAYTGMLILALSNLASKEYNWGYVLDQETMVILSESFITDIFQLVFYACVLTGMVRFFVLNRLWKYAWSGILSVGIYLWGVIVQQPLPFLVGLLIFVVTQGLLFRLKPEFVTRSSKSIYYLWFLLAFLTALEVSNFYL